MRKIEHNPGVLLQALGFAMPSFAHVSLILVPNRSKLSKRHGATSVRHVIPIISYLTSLPTYLLIIHGIRMRHDLYFSLHSIKRWAIYLRQW
jgi:glutamyl-tRNA synthetase